VPGHLFPPVYGDKAREVLLNQEAQHAIRMASTSVPSTRFQLLHSVRSDP
jgi:hypothetical protein